MKKHILLFVWIIIQTNLYAQNSFVYKSLPNKYATSVKAAKSVVISSESQVLTNSGNDFDLSKLLPKGFVKDGSVDYTAYIQKGLDSHRHVRFPDFPVLINVDGLSVKSNSILYFPDNSLLLMAPNDSIRYEVLRLHNTENVVLHNPKIKGDRDEHKGTEGEWGMGIDLRSANNIQILNPMISHCWGDGIYIGRMYNHKASNGVTISGGHIDYNRRNGISIVSGENIVIDCTVISNTEGNLPMSGIDIEPNYNNDEANNITINNVVTFNNAKSGIVIDLRRLPGKVRKNVNININNHIDEISEIGFYISSVAKTSSPDSLPMKGAINVSNSTLIDNITPVNTGRDLTLLPETTIKGMSVEKAGSRSLQNLKNRSKDIANLKVVD